MKMNRTIVAAGALLALVAPSVSAKKDKDNDGDRYRDRRESRDSRDRGTPPGWDRGRKEGWNGRGVPPGQWRRNDRDDNDRRENRNRRRYDRNDRRDYRYDRDRDGIPDTRDRWLDLDRDGRRDPGEIRRLPSDYRYDGNTMRRPQRDNRSDRDRDGIPDIRDTWVDLDRDGKMDRGEVRRVTR